MIYYNLIKINEVIFSYGSKKMEAKNLLGKPVLILNGDYQPLSRYPLSLNTVKKVIKSLLKGRLSVIKEYDDIIYIKNKEFKLPKIVVLKKYINVSHTPKFSRKNVYLRDNYTCQYCGKKFSDSELTFDHVIPRCKGGKTTWDNIVTACKECNGKKGGKTLEESHMNLIHRPFIPSISLLEKNADLCEKNSYKDWYNELNLYNDLGG